MIIEPRKKSKTFLIVMMAVFALVIISPFLISSKIFLAALYVIYFLLMAYLWKEFNKLRLSDKKEMEDQALAELEHNVEKIAGPETIQDNQK